MTVIKRAIRKANKKRLRYVIKSAVPFIFTEIVRPHLPRTGEKIKFNEIAVAEFKIVEKHLPRFVTKFSFPPEDKPKYKESNCNLLKKYVKPDDRVIIVGGGFGVTTAVAAKELETGIVVSYEGGEERVKRIKKTLHLNEVSSEKYNIVHGIVGEDAFVIGTENNAKNINIQDIPTCDVLEIDCEGTELEILNELKCRPRIIIVESHPEKKSPTIELIDSLASKGYSILEKYPDPNSGHIIAAKQSHIDKQI